MTISLHDLYFEAFHGFYEEERILGNTFVVNCSVEIREPQHIIRDLGETINYQAVFELIKAQMKIPELLLETLCMKIGNHIHESFPEIISVSISIKKLYPPVSSFHGSSSVSWHKVF